MSVLNTLTQGVDPIPPKPAGMHVIQWTYHLAKIVYDLTDESCADAFRSAKGLYDGSQPGDDEALVEAMLHIHAKYSFEQVQAWLREAEDLLLEWGKDKIVAMSAERGDGFANDIAEVFEVSAMDHPLFSLEMRNKLLATISMVHQEDIGPKETPLVQFSDVIDRCRSWLPKQTEGMADAQYHYHLAKMIHDIWDDHAHETAERRKMVFAVLLDIEPRFDESVSLAWLEEAEEELLNWGAAKVLPYVNTKHPHEFEMLQDAFLISLKTSSRYQPEMRQHLLHNLSLHRR